MIAAGTGTILILSFRFFETDDGISVLSARGRWGEASPLIRIRVDRTDRGGAGSACRKRIPVDRHVIISAYEMDLPVKEAA